MKHFTIALFALMAYSGNSFAQEADKPVSTDRYTAHNKGKFFVYWGGNRESFSESDITFTGNGYHFTINDVEAHDKPKGVHIDYINPTRMTIPQTNFKIGYFISDHYAILAGVDHMKYVMTTNQVVNMTGTITGHAPFDGTYNNEPMAMTEDFLKFEHTDGLNYINVGVARYDDLTKYFHVNTDIVQLNVLYGVEGGMLYPKTNTTLMGMQRHDDYHISGWGANVKAGLMLTFLKHYFISSEFKEGYINMPDIRTTYDGADRAKQHFTFFQRNFVVGGIFKV